MLLVIFQQTSARYDWRIQSRKKLALNFLIFFISYHVLIWIPMQLCKVDITSIFQK